MAKFKQGQSGNPAGRKRGAINKLSRPLKEQLSTFVNDKFMELPAIWAKLTPRDRANFIKDLLPFVVPKLSNVDMDADINFSAMSEADLDGIAMRLINNKKHEE